MHIQRWSSIEDLAGPQLRTKFGVIEVKSIFEYTAVSYTTAYISFHQIPMFT